MHRIRSFFSDRFAADSLSLSRQPNMVSNIKAEPMLMGTTELWPTHTELVYNAFRRFSVFHVHLPTWCVYCVNCKLSISFTMLFAAIARKNWTINHIQNISYTHTDNYACAINFACFVSIHCAHGTQCATVARNVGHRCIRQNRKRNTILLWLDNCEHQAMHIIPDSICDMKCVRTVCTVQSRRRNKVRLFVFIKIIINNLFSVSLSRWPARRLNHSSVEWWRSH